MFLDVTKRSNIVLEKQISDVWPTTFNRLARPYVIKVKTGHPRFNSIWEYRAEIKENYAETFA